MATNIGTRSKADSARHMPAALEVERGPGWLFVGVTGAPDALAESVWETIREHGASRVVLELDRVDRVDESLGDAIAELGARVRDAGGLIRICGLSPSGLTRLRRVEATAAVPHFGSRSEAVGTRRVEAGPCE